MELKPIIESIVKPITRQKLVDEARTWLGVRFRHQGRTRNGVDCVGLLICVAQNVLNKSPIIIKNYSKRPGQQEIFDDIQNHLIKIKKAMLQPGDIVQLQYGGYPTHFAMFTGKTLIHAMAMNKKVIEQSFVGELPRRVVACYMIPGVLKKWRK